MVSIADESTSSAAIAQAAPAGNGGATFASGAEGHDKDGPPAEPYYWEPGGNSALDFWGKLRHQVHFGGIKAIGGAEAIGEVVANALGLNDSKYQYVIDALEADKYRREKEERDEEDRRKLEEEQARQDAVVVDAQPADLGHVELGDASLTRTIPIPSDGVVDVPLT